LGKSRIAWVALNLALSPCPLAARSLLERFRDPEAVLAASARRIEDLPGVTPRALRRLRDPRLLEAAAAEMESASRLSVRILIRDDPEYPGILAQLPDPPPLLYVRGSLAAGDDPAVALVGSRRASPYGLEMARSLAEEMASAGVTVVSGLARGIDESAHRGAMEGGGRTVAFLGSGIDRVYPPESGRLSEAISRHGALLSEFPLGTPPLPGNFPVRNRLISGMCRGVVVVEAAPRSGSLITARLALEQGREVLAVPGNVTSRGALGPDFLIQQGAKLVMRGRDILEEIPGIDLPPEAEADRPLTRERDQDAGKPEGEADRLLSLVPPDDPIALDDLAEKAGMEIGPLLAVLLDLEMSGRVARFPGRRFLRKTDPGRRTRRARIG
jgi:DNA processing protein